MAQKPIIDATKIRLYAGRIHPVLCERISHHLGIPLSEALVSDFSNGETRIEIKDSCRGCHAYIIQPICSSEDGKLSVNDALMEVFVYTSALKRASAKSVTAVLPIYGYARQDKKEKLRASITARLVADLLEASGIDRLITVDLHSSQIEGFFSKPVDNVAAQTIIIKHIKARWKHCFESPGAKENNPLMVVSPDAGGAKRAVSVAKQLGVETAILSKERAGASMIERMMVVGNVSGKICILVDDMADTCGTIVMAAEKLMQTGAKEVHAYVIHGVFSGEAIKKLNACKALSTIVSTNTLPMGRVLKSVDKLQLLDVSPLLASAIQLIHNNKSLTSHL